MTLGDAGPYGDVNNKLKLEGLLYEFTYDLMRQNHPAIKKLDTMYAMYIINKIGDTRWKQSQLLVEKWLQYYELSDKNKHGKADKLYDQLGELQVIYGIDDEDFDRAQSYLHYKKSQEIGYERSGPNIYIPLDNNYKYMDSHNSYAGTLCNETFWK